MKTKAERIQRDIEALAAFNADPGNGLTRLSFSEEHKNAQEYIVSQMEEAGLSVRIDACGTIIGRLEGSDPAAACIMKVILTLSAAAGISTVRQVLLQRLKQPGYSEMRISVLCDRLNLLL